MKELTACIAALLCWACILPAALGQGGLEKDIIPTSAGAVEITFIGHGSLMLRFNNRIIHVDPYAKVADYRELPRADLILLTHHHQDHLDESALALVRDDKTELLLTGLCARQVTGGTVMANGDNRKVLGIGVEAVPAYNIVHRRDSGELFHPKGEGNGYVLTFGDTRIYIAGDTENTPEMKALKKIDYAFLPMNLPYTMTPEMVADAALTFRPRVLYPYHYGETDTAQLVELLNEAGDIEVRIRRMP
ncbi:MAG: MBL fold metallo-hydrolase [Thermodesulfobacteriota bacterium]